MSGDPQQLINKKPLWIWSASPCPASRFSSSASGLTQATCAGSSACLTEISAETSSTVGADRRKHEEPPVPSAQGDWRRAALPEHERPCTACEIRILPRPRFPRPRPPASSDAHSSHRRVRSSQPCVQRVSPRPAGAVRVCQPWRLRLPSKA